MRIGIDARMTFYSQAGIGQYIRRLAEGLAQIDAEEQFIFLQSRKDKPLCFSNRRFRCRRLWTPSHHRLEQWVLPLETAMTGVDVLHSPDFIPPFHRTCKSIITVHDLAFLLYPHFLTEDSARYYGQIDEAVRRTNHIIAVSESTKRDIIRLLGVRENKISVICEAADPHFSPVGDPGRLHDLARRYGLRERFILFVSTIEPRKNLTTLLRTMRLLLDRHGPLAQLVVVGRRGWLFEEVDALIDALHLEADVKFLDRVSDDDLVLLYNAATCLAYPSLYEGFGLPPLEAMACGCPVVVSNVASLPEVVGDAGMLVEPEDVEGWATTLGLLVADANLRWDLRGRGLRQATKFSLERMARETLAAYRLVACT